MTGRKPDVASQYGALDSGAVVDGDAAHAHVLSTVSRNVQRLVVRGEPLFVGAWDSSTDSGEAVNTGSLTGYAVFGAWSRIIPGPITVDKSPWHSKATLRVVAKIGNGLNAYLQVVTRGAQPASSTDAPNVLTMAGTGAFVEYALTGVDLGPNDTEDLDFLIQGDPTSTGLNTGTYGTPASGTVSSVGIDWFEDVTTPANWNAGTTTPKLTDDSRHVVLFTEPVSGALLIPPVSPRWVMLKTGSTTKGYTIAFDPEITQAMADQLNGLPAAYAIRILNTWRISGISLYAEDRCP